MSFVRVGLGALVAAASLHWSVAQAASATQSGGTGMQQDSTKQDSTSSMKSDSSKQGSTGSMSRGSSKQEAAASSSSDSSSKGQAKERSASGEVKGIDAKALTFSDGEQFRISDQTSFDKAGQKVSRDQVKPGDQVKASYEARNKLAYATKIEVTSGAESQAAPGTKGQSEAAASQGTGSMGKDSQGSNAQDKSSQGTGTSATQDSNGLNKSGQDSGSQSSTSTPPSQSGKTQ